MKDDGKRKGQNTSTHNNPEKAEIGNTQNRKKKSEIEQAKELYPEKKTTPRTPTKGDEK